MKTFKQFLSESTLPKKLTVYHGTSSKFTRFDPKMGAQGLIWFTSNKDKILNGTVGAQGKGYIITAEVTINKPAGWEEYHRLGLWELQRGGFDGAILPDEDGKGNFDCFVFKASQVKILKNEKVLKESVVKERWDSSKLEQYIQDNCIEKYSGFLYHGTPPDGLVTMLEDGIMGTPHGELSEDNTFSTSSNPEVLKMFSDGNDYMGLTFKVQDIKVFIVDDILGHLLTRLQGSGISFDFEEDEYEEFCKEHNIPRDKRDFYLPFNFVTNLKGVDAWCYEYAWDRINHPRDRDESEICFIGNDALKYLNESIYDITIADDMFDISEKEKAIEALKEIDKG